MVPPLRRPPSARGRPDGSLLVFARICVVTPWVSLIVLMGTAAVVPGLRRSLGWALAALVAVAVAGLLGTFARRPWPSRQDGELTFTLVVGSLLMVVPGLVSGFWLVAALPLVTPLLVAGAAVRERRSGARGGSSRA